jgi:hypothetical protein
MANTADANTRENYILSDNVQFAPFRTLNEFALDARFEVSYFAAYKYPTRT